MNKKKLFFTLLFIMNINYSSAEVWQTNQNWNEYWEREYSKWIENKIAKTIFKEKIGILSGIETDCADALYDLRILFSYENGLPFVVNAPHSLIQKQNTFGNETTMFDSIKNEKQKVRAFISFINEEMGTDSLAKDTYPVKIESISPGTIYLVEWSLFGKTNHHSYFIKGFDRDNEPIYYSSDAPKKVRKFQADYKYPKFSFDRSPFGFRKWRHPEIILVPEEKIPTNYDYSREQYELLKKYGKRSILNVINSILKKINH